MPNPEPDNAVQITFHDGFIHILHPDNFMVLPEELEGLWLSLAEACKVYDCQKVLNEGNLDLSKLRGYDAYSAGAQAGEIDGLRMACLFQNHQPNEKDEFFKTVSANRGSKVEFFNDRAEALKWLEVDESE